MSAALPTDRATAAEPVVSALRDGIPSADVGNIFIPEMVEALDELHGCILRRPGDTCEVRKEFLAVALSVMAAVIGEAMAPESSA